jgi:hypothetical protein
MKSYILLLKNVKHKSTTNTKFSYCIHSSEKIIGECIKTFNQQTESEEGEIIYIFDKMKKNPIPYISNIKIQPLVILGMNFSNTNIDYNQYQRIGTIHPVISDTIFINHYAKNKHYTINRDFREEFHEVDKKDKRLWRNIALCLLINELHEGEIIALRWNKKQTT